jgi:hypothetical protein
MKFFLRAKHWLLFVLTFGIPMLLDMVIILNTFRAMAGQANGAASNDDGSGYFILLPAGFLLFVYVLMGWMYAVAVGLQKMMPPGIKMKVTLFKIFFFTPLAYITLIICFMLGAFNGSGNPHFNPIILVAIIPLHLFSTFCMFYNLYFVAKTLKTVELQREAYFSDFVLEFFLVWFFPIGVWILQPRVNKLIKAYDTKAAVVSEP